VPARLLTIEGHHALVQEMTMTAIRSTLAALALAASVAVNLAACGTASARGSGRMPSYSEGLWKEPVKPGLVAEPVESARGNGVRTEPVRGIGPKPPAPPAMPR
jgi:hypothetical protein